MDKFVSNRFYYSKTQDEEILNIQTCYSNSLFINVSKITNDYTIVIYHILATLFCFCDMDTLLILQLHLPCLPTI